MIKFGANADMILLIIKMPPATSINAFRFILEQSSGIVGPAAATTSAKPLTSHPAVAMLTLYCSAIMGRIPTIPISVFRIPKTPSVKIRIILLLYLFISH